MNLRKLFMVVFLAVAMCVMSAGVGAAAVITVDDSGSADFTSIQAAVDAASEGDTIEVRSGTYVENVDVGKRLTLRGEGAGVVTVTAASSSDHVFEVTADYVNISGFTATGMTGYSHADAGIRLSGADNCNISENNASLNNWYGIHLYDSSNNTLMNNTANSNNWCGIKLGSSSNNTLTSNNASLNGDYGIYLHDSSNNTLLNNTMSGNVYNFGVYSGSLSEYTQNIDTSNTVDGKPIYYWVDQKDRQIPSDAGFVGVVNGTNVTVRDLTLTNNSHGVLFACTENSRIENVTANSNKLGIYLHDSSNNTLTSNTANSNYYPGIFLSASSNNTLTSNTANSNNVFECGGGIYLHSSSYNTLANNNASSNYDGGINLRSSSNNASNNDFGIFLYYSSNDNTITNNNANSNNYNGIYLRESNNDNTITNNNASLNTNGIYLYGSSDNLIYNNYFNNTANAYDNGVNQWNITKTAGTNIVGGSWLGGNYWSDYAGNDTDGDGLGDTITPYNSGIQNGGDYHPLVMSDNTPPPGITYLHNITYAQTYINWTWTNPSDPDFNHTELYLNGTFLANIPTPQNYYNATGLLPDTSYELGTHTVDRSGNINLTWVNDTASTLPASGTTLNLYTGWNLISLHLMPEDTSITSLLSPISGNYSIVWEYNASDTSDHWKKYDPSAPFGNDLINMEPGKGYWIMMISDDTLLISGTVPESTDINLTIGWNLIGYNSLDSQPVAEALSSISGNYTIGWAYDASDTADHWKKYDPLAPFGNDLEIMEPGKGYWIMMSANDYLRYSFSPKYEVM